MADGVHGGGNGHAGCNHTSPASRKRASCRYWNSFWKLCVMGYIYTHSHAPFSRGNAMLSRLRISYPEAAHAIPHHP